MPDLARDWAEWIERPLPRDLAVRSHEGPGPLPFWVWCPKGDPEGGDILVWSDRPPAVCLWDHPVGRMAMTRGPMGRAWLQCLPEPTPASYLGLLRPLLHPASAVEPAWT